MAESGFVSAMKCVYQRQLFFLHTHFKHPKAAVADAVDHELRDARFGVFLLQFSHIAGDLAGA